MILSMTRLLVRTIDYIILVVYSIINAQILILLNSTPLTAKLPTAKVLMFTNDKKLLLATHH